MVPKICFYCLLLVLGYYIVILNSRIVWFAVLFSGVVVKYFNKFSFNKILFYSAVAGLTNSQGITVDGNTSVSYDSYGNLILNIKLNSTTLSDATKEYISATIYHEIVHAYLRATGMIGRLQQENAIASDYVTCLTSALQETFPSMSLESATALSWGGLEGTSTYNNTLTDTQKTNYAIENNYQHAGQNGTNCN